MENLIVDIQRCSIYDGPGIRTTIFLKGCPLKCQWCHNKESLSYKKEISFNSEKCNKCLRCKDVCEKSVHYIQSNKHMVNYIECDKCGKCIDVCPNKALLIIGKELSVDEIIDIVKKDKRFYDNSKGGITLSGGEALSNIKFSKEILRRCKEENISTCIETSGYTSKENLDLIMEYVDLFLYDYKLNGKELHQKYTGVSNEVILENLEYINKHNKEIILRCPIIPDVNDFEEHFKAIRNLGESLKNIKKVELLPYHDFGVIKSENLGQESIKFRVPSKIEKEEWKSFFSGVSFDFKIN